MPLLSPQVDGGTISKAMVRVASRFYFFGILLVAATIYLPLKRPPHTAGLKILIMVAVGLIAVLKMFPWNKYRTRTFTLFHLASSCATMAFLVYCTGGAQSPYQLLFFLIILFAYFYNLQEMFAITTVVSLFFLLPFLYQEIDPYRIAESAVTILFFYLGTYFLFVVTGFVLRKNEALEELNNRISELSSLATALLRDLETGSLESFSESLKSHIPSTYCMLLLMDDTMNLTIRLSCPLRTLEWEPPIGAVFGPDRLTGVRSVFETRQPVLYQIDEDDVDDDLKCILTKTTSTVLVVPVRIGSEDGGALIFGEERHWNRAPFTHEKIQLAVAISRQVAVGVQLWHCYKTLLTARRELEESRDDVIKAERLAALGEVTMAMEHEINNPLSVIVNWSELYREDSSIDPELQKKFQVIYDMSLRIMDVVRALSETKATQSMELTKDQRWMHILQGRSH